MKNFWIDYENFWYFETALNWVCAKPLINIKTEIHENRSIWRLRHEIKGFQNNFLHFMISIRRKSSLMIQLL